MKTTVVFAHPWHGSFNKAILDAVVESRRSRGEDVAVIDLYREGFSPAMSEQDLAVFARGESADPLVARYQALLKQTSELVMIFPVWWYEAPAMVKGFVDKVMLKDFAYVPTKTGLKGLLTHIKRTTIITTGEGPRWYLRLFKGNAIGGTFIRCVLKDLGIKKARWFHKGFAASNQGGSNARFIEVVRRI